MTAPAEQATGVVQAYGPDGNVVEVPADRAAGLVRSGTITLGENSEIGVPGADGRLVSLKGEAALSYLQSPEALLQAPSGAGALLEQSKRDEWDTAGGIAKGVGLGALDTATLGLGTAAGAYLSDDFRQTVNDAERYAPGSYMAGQGLGLVPALVATVSSGGGAAAAGGAAAGGTAAVEAGSIFARGGLAAARALPSALAAGAGQAGERAAARALAGIGVEGSGVLASGARVAAGQAVEQAFYGAGEAVRHAALENVDLTAERVLAGAGWGALSGAALGGVLGAGGAVLSKGASKAADVASAVRANAAAKELETAARLEGAVAKTENGTRAILDEFAREQALKSTGITAGDLKKLAELPKDIQDRYIRMAVEDLPAAAGAKEGQLLSKAEKYDASRKLVNKIGSERAALVQELAESGVVVTSERVVQRANANVALLSRMGGESAADAAKAAKHWGQQAEEFISKEGVDGVWRMRQELRPDIQKAIRSGDDLKRDALISIRESLDKTLEQAASDIGGRPDFALKWAETAREYVAAKRLEGVLEKASAAEKGTKIFGLTESLGSAATLAAGGIAGLPMALAGTAASHVYKRHGADLGYQLAMAASRGEMVSALARLAEANLNSSVGTLVGDVVRKGASTASVAAKNAPTVLKRGAAALPPLAREVDRIVRDDKARSKSLSDEYQRVVAEVRAWQTAGRGAPGARDLFDGAPPQMIKAIENRVQVAGGLLEKALPSSTPPPGATVQGHLEDRKPSAAEMQRLVDTKRIIDDPGYVAQLAREGRLTPEHVAVWRTAQPIEYERVRAHTMAAVAGRTDPLPYRQALQLSTLLDIPADATTTPEFVSFSQSLYPAGVQPSGPQGGGQSPAPSSLKPPSGGNVKTTVSFSQKLSGG